MNTTKAIKLLIVLLITPVTVLALQIERGGAALNGEINPIALQNSYVNPHGSNSSPYNNNVNSNVSRNDSVGMPYASSTTTTSASANHYIPGVR